MNVTPRHVRVKQMPPENWPDTVNKESHSGKETQSFFSPPLTLSSILLGGIKKRLSGCQLGGTLGKKERIKGIVP